MGKTVGPISREQVEQARQSSVWTLAKQVLYDLCAEYPGHERDDVIIAKVWLIGRSHSAAIERRKTKDQVPTDSFYEEWVAPAMRASELDDYLHRLRNYQQIDEQSLPDILDTHGYLTQIFYDLTQLSKRSLASKYLHFHLPHLFFIYDNLAYAALLNHMPRKRVSNEGLGTNHDYDYRRFCLLTLELRDAIEREHGVCLTPQEMDNLLLVGNI
jgi:hypothetical protein